MPITGGVGESGPPAGIGAGHPDPNAVTPAMRLQILSTEHWSLLASRNLAWSESFSRAGMFLTTLTGAIVALALVAQATEFGEGFRVFALVILPIVVFVGAATLLRLGIANYHDVVCVVGMNRIRAAYLELAPDLQRYFVMGSTDDWRGIDITMAHERTHSAFTWLMASVPMLVAVVNAVLVAAIAALLAIQLGTNGVLALGAAAAGFALTVLLEWWYANRTIAKGVVNYQPMFPGPDAA
jgi:hypothetical protein